MTKSLSKTIKPVPDENQSHKGPGSAPGVPVDTTKGHRDDEKHNVREQAEHGNIVQNTSNRRSGYDHHVFERNAGKRISPLVIPGRCEAANQESIERHRKRQNGFRARA